MAEGRTPAGWVAAYKMSPKPFIFVEGCSDEWFWKKFIDKESVQLHQVNGWKKVKECVAEFNKNDLENVCIGIVDSDFESIHPHKGITESNIFSSDVHDIEMMMYNSPAWEAALQAIDKKNRVTEHPHNVLNNALLITDHIGYLKLTALKQGIELHFKKHKDKTGEIELPVYEKKILDENGNYTKDADLINYIHSYSKALSRKPKDIPSVKEITDYYEEESNVPYESFHLSNGHDLSYIMSHVLKRKYKSEANVETLEACLHSAYSFEYFRTTQLYDSINNWGTTNHISIFLQPPTNP